MPLTGAGTPPTNTSFSTTLPDDVTIFEVDCNNFSSVRFTLSGTWSGQVEVEMTTNGTDWESVVSFSTLLNQSFSGIEANGIYVCNCIGIQTIRFYCSSLASGTVDLDGITTADATILTANENTLGIRGDVRIKASDDVALNAGQQLMSGSLPIVIASDQTAIPISGSFSLPVGAATAANQLTEITSLASIDGKMTAVNTGAVVVASSALPTGAATAALQTQPGVDIGDVTVNNASGGSAVNIQDGGNSITVDGTVAIGAGSAVIGHVVTDSGSVTAATLSAETTKVIGTVNIAAAQTLANVTTLGTVTNVVHVDDNSGSLTVDNNGTFAVQATVAASATNIAKAEDVASADADVGVPAMAIRKATPANTSGTDGDYEMLQMSAGRLWTSATIDAAIPAGSNAIGKLAANDGVDIGDVTINNASGGSAVNIQDGGNSITVDGAVTASIAAAQTLATVTTVGTVTTITNVVHVDDNSGSLTVDNNGTFAVQATVAASATNIAKAEDTASADLDVGVPAMAIRKATPANTSGTDGDYEMLQMSAGRLWTSAAIDTALPAGTNAIGKLSANSGVIIGDVNVVNTNISTNTAQMNGVTVTMGNGASGTGVQRVTLANDSTGQVVLATGAAAIGKLTANSGVIIGDVNVVNSNVSTNIAQMNGVATTMGNGASGTGVQRVTLASDSTGQVTLATGANTIGALTANQSINNAQVNGGTVVTSVTGIQDVMTRKRTGATGLSPNYSASHITSKTTTTPTAATAYVSAIVISCSAAGTTWTMVIQNKEGTPKILVPSFTLTVPTTGLPVILQFAEPILMTSGIDIVTGGTTAGTVDVYITYWA